MEPEGWENINYLLHQMSLQNEKHSRHKSIFLENFKVIGPDHIGGGSFGFVYKVDKPIHSGNIYDVINFENFSSSYGFQSEFAMKLIANFNGKDGYQEIMSLSSLIHPNIVRCYNGWVENFKETPFSEWNIIESRVLRSVEIERKRTGAEITDSCGERPPRVPGFMKTCLFLQYEFCNGGTLSSILKLRDKSGINCVSSVECYLQTKDLIMQFTEGLVYMEFNEIIHGDLKPSNVFLKKVNGRLILKIGDFGLSKSFIMVEPDTAMISYSRNQDDCIYTPPENSDSYSNKSDMYCFGLILIAMLVPVTNQVGRNKLVLDAMDQKQTFTPVLAEKFPIEFEWIKRLICYEMSERPTAFELKRLASTVKYSLPDFKITGEKKNKILNCLLPFVTNLSEVKNETQFYKFGNELFYEILPILQFDKNNEDFFRFERKLNLIGLRFGDGEKNCYRGVYCLSYLENNVEPDKNTLEFQIEVHRTILAYLKPCSSSNAKKKETLLKHTVQEVERVCEIISNKIENSSVFVKLEDKDELKMHYYFNYCFSVAFNNKSSKEMLEEALGKNTMVIDFYEHKLIASQGSFGFNELSESQARKARLLCRLGRKNEANEVYLAMIEYVFPKYSVGITDNLSIECIYLYVEFLIHELSDYTKSRIYCEALCCILVVKKPLSDYYYLHLLALQRLAEIYYELGFQQEVDFILEFFYLEIETQMLNSAIDKTSSWQFSASDQVLEKTVRKLVNMSDEHKLFQSSFNYLEGHSEHGKEFTACKETILLLARTYRKVVDDTLKQTRIMHPDRKFLTYPTKKLDEGDK